MSFRAVAPLAFDTSKTRVICDAFDGAWAFLQSVGSDLTGPSKSLAARTILAKRVIEMAHQGMTTVTELSDDALAFLERNPPSSQSQRAPAEAPPEPRQSRSRRIGKYSNREGVR